MTTSNSDLYHKIEVLQNTISHFRTEQNAEIIFLRWLVAFAFGIGFVLGAVFSKGF